MIPFISIVIKYIILYIESLFLRRILIASVSYYIINKIRIRLYCLFGL